MLWDIGAVKSIKNDRIVTMLVLEEEPPPIVNVAVDDRWQREISPRHFK